ncbi:class I adenylate-forming enzyme family protein [Mycolicibacterium sp. XJ1819]
MGGLTTLRQRWHREGWFSDRTLLDAFESTAASAPSTPVVFLAGTTADTVTVGEIHRSARALAAALQDLGVAGGDAVAVQLTNRVECAIAYQAVLLCGAVLVPIVHIYGPAEVGFIVAESGAAVLIMPRRYRSIDYTERLADLSRIDTLRHIVIVDAAPGPDHLAWSQLDGDPGSYRRPAVHADDVCLLLYTSGTTAAPKGVQHTHNTVLAEQRTAAGLLAGAAGDVLLVGFPPGHIAGVGNILRPMTTEKRCVFVDEWSPQRAVDAVAQFGVTATAGAPIHLQGILEVPDATTKLATLREFLVGAAPVSEELGLRAADRGIATFRCYGSTEHPTVTAGHADEPRSARLGTDGMPLPGSAVRIVGPDGTDVPTGVDGEVVLQGPDQFVGYRDSTLDAEAFTADGWFRTGDLGHLDGDGRLTITDRIKDVVIRGGETISSAQVEDVLLTHPAVAEAAAVAAPDPRYGDVVAAVVVLTPGAALTLADLRTHFAAAGLARQKCPERLIVVDRLPRTPLGKVRKAEVRAAHFG